MSNIPKPRLLIVSNDIVAARMAGPGIRYLEIGRALCHELDITLASPGRGGLESEEINLAVYDNSSSERLRLMVENSDFVLVSPFVIRKFAFLERVKAGLIVDLYDPFLFENLYYYIDEPRANQDALNLQSVDTINRAAQVGDFFICGNARQRDFWLGVLAANGRITPSSMINDPELKNLIDVVGIGFPTRQPDRRPLLRGRHPLIPADARMVVWGGGLWNWLDPISLVEAWPSVIKAFPQARLVFLGTRHPNPEVPRHQIVDRTIAAAQATGEKDKTIMFIDWLPFQDREALLSEADVGVSLHNLTIETHFSIRTRVFDYLWAGLPVLVSGGDFASEMVQAFNVGIVVPPRDVDAIAAGLVTILEKPKAAWTSSAARLYQEYNWQNVVVPLKNYCFSAYLNPGKRNKRLPGAIRSSRINNIEGIIARARFVWKTEGLEAVWRKTWRGIRSRIL